jgi:hypothetical protein
MFDSDSFDTQAFSTDAFDILAEQPPQVIGPLLGRRPAINRTRENDEALLLALGLL